MNEIRNEFSWSESGDEILQTCPRQYHFNYYAYWGGWEKDVPERTRQIYILMNLKNRYMWAGEADMQSLLVEIENNTRKEKEFFRKV